MLDGGGGGGGTSWYGYDLPSIWAIVQGQDREGLWKQATGWKNTADLTGLNLYNLTSYRDQLAEAWPPERSQAAQAYIGELNKLITSVQETQDAASANHTAMVSIAYALSDAQNKVKPLYDEYAANKQKLDDYQAKVTAAQSNTGTPQPMPGPPPVSTSRQQELTNQARSLMASISSEITQAAATLRLPKPYTPPPPRRDPPDSGTDGGAAGPVLVPPVLPTVTNANTSTPTNSTTPASSWVPTGSSTPPVTGTPTPSGPGVGPILGGTPGTAPTAPPGTLLPTPTGPVPAAPSPLPSGGFPPGTLPTTLPSGPGSSLLNPAKGGLPGGTRPLGTGTPRPVGRAMPAGGVIGGSSKTGLGQPGRGAAGMRRVNPPGGVIGGKEGPGRGGPAGRGTTGSAGRGAGVARSGRRREEGDEQAMQWDPDNPWETEEGVAPIVLPSEGPHRIDPGPSIGPAR